MIIPLDKLLTYAENKYVFSKATISAVERIGNIKKYPETDISWKVVPNILKLTLDGDLKFIHHEILDSQAMDK